MPSIHIEPLMYRGEVTTYRVTGVRPDGSSFCDFGATRELAIRFGMAAARGFETRSPFALGRLLAHRALRRLPITFMESTGSPRITRTVEQTHAGRRIGHIIVRENDSEFVPAYQ